MGTAKLIFLFLLVLWMGEPLQAVGLPCKGLSVNVLLNELKTTARNPQGSVEEQFRLASSNSRNLTRALDILYREIRLQVKALRSVDNRSSFDFQPVLSFLTSLTKAGEFIIDEADRNRLQSQFNYLYSIVNAAPISESMRNQFGAISDILDDLSPDLRRFLINSAPNSSSTPLQRLRLKYSSEIRSNMLQLRSRSVAADEKMKIILRLEEMLNLSAVDSILLSNISVGLMRVFREYGGEESSWFKAAQELFTKTENKLDALARDG